MGKILFTIDGTIVWFVPPFTVSKPFEGEARTKGELRKVCDDLKAAMLDGGDITGPGALEVTSFEGEWTRKTEQSTGGDLMFEGFDAGDVEEWCEKVYRVMTAPVDEVSTDRVPDWKKSDWTISEVPFPFVRV